jgi:LysM repeat protein
MVGTLRTHFSFRVTRRPLRAPLHPLRAVRARFGPACAAFLVLVFGFVSPALGYVYTHEVLPGDSLARIANRYHITVKQLRRQNRSLRRRKVLRAGQKLRIETKVPCKQLHKVLYRVRPGDSPSRIARKFKMKRWLLSRLNPRLRKQPRLRIGQKIWVVKEGRLPRGVGGMYRLSGEGPGYRVVSRSRSWGTFLTVTRLMEVFAEHARRYPEAAPLLVGDISRKGGGFLRPHRSHRRGRDVDIRFPLNIRTRHYVAASPKTLDVKRTWDLIERFIKTGDVVYIFVDRKLQRVLYEYVKSQRRFSKKQLREYFQYPRGRGSMQGIIRHEPGHSTHMHVRFGREKRAKPTS